MFTWLRNLFGGQVKSTGEPVRDMSDVAIAMSDVPVEAKKTAPKKTTTSKTTTKKAPAKTSAKAPAKPKAETAKAEPAKKRGRPKKNA